MGSTFVFMKDQTENSILSGEKIIQEHCIHLWIHFDWRQELHSFKCDVLDWLRSRWLQLVLIASRYNWLELINLSYNTAQGRRRRSGKPVEALYASNANTNTKYKDKWKNKDKSEVNWKTKINTEKEAECVSRSKEARWRMGGGLRCMKCKFEVKYKNPKQKRRPFLVRYKTPQENLFSGRMSPKYISQVLV